MDLRFQRHKIFHNCLKNNIVGSIHSEKISFLEGGVNNLADSYHNIHLRIVE